MASRKPAFVTGKLNHDPVRGAALGLLVSLGLIALLSVIYLGV
jgi:hypothetical protein